MKHPIHVYAHQQYAVIVLCSVGCLKVIIYLWRTFEGYLIFWQAEGFSRCFLIRFISILVNDQIGVCMLIEL